MTTCSERQYTPYYPVVRSVPMALPKWAPEELFDPLDFANIKGGLHDLPKDDNPWIPKFSGEVGLLETPIGPNFVKAMTSISL